MKALSLWQPWATAVALGSKRIETRGWVTSYHGPLAIHAAKRYHKREMLNMGADPMWRGALNHQQASDLRWLPYGAIVAVCRLVECFHTDNLRDHGLFVVRSPTWATDGTYDWDEQDMGNYAAGRFGWVLEDVRAIEPIPWRGAQGLFEIPDDVLP